MRDHRLNIRSQRKSRREPLSPSEAHQSTTKSDGIWFILVYLKTYALQVVQGRLFGMVQGKANQWIHVLPPALLAALRALGDAPARSLTALAQRLGVSEADAASVVGSVAEERHPSPRQTPPFAHDGTERRIVRPQDPAEQTDCYGGEKRPHGQKCPARQCLARHPLSERHPRRPYP